MAGPLQGDAAPPSALPASSQAPGPLTRWVDQRLPVVSAFRRGYVDYPMPRNLTYLWAFGAFATVAAVALVLSGIFLAIDYTPTSAAAFASVEAIDRQVSSGWVIRSMHMAGTSLFFVALYVHVYRSLYYGSYKRPRELVWLTAVLLLLVSMISTFAGYVLPWGQMSYWSAVVLSDTVSAIPGFGHSLATGLQGDNGLGDASLHRYYVLHLVTGFLILGVLALHAAALQVTGPDNPLGIEATGPRDTLPFHPYYTAKYGLGLCVFLLAFAVLVFYLPGLLTVPDNFIEANPLSKPSDITPEWYFAPFYAILRAVPSRFGSLLLPVGSVLVLFAVPWLDTAPVRSALFRPTYRKLMAVLVIAFLVLLVAGLHRPAGVWLVLSRLATLYWFLHFLVLLPLLSHAERTLPVPDSFTRPAPRPRPGLRARLRRAEAVPVPSRAPLPSRTVASPMERN